MSLFLFEALGALLQQRMQPGKPCGSCVVETVLVVVFFTLGVYMNELNSAGLCCWDRVAFYFSGLCSHCSWDFTYVFSTNVLLTPYMSAYSTFLAPLHWFYIGSYHAEATITIWCMYVWNQVLLYVQTRYTSASQRAIEVNGHDDFAEVGGHRFPARMREKEFGSVFISNVTIGTI